MSLKYVDTTGEENEECMDCGKSVAAQPCVVDHDDCVVYCWECGHKRIDAGQAALDDFLDHLQDR
jgi:hypothetical protein